MPPEERQLFPLLCSVCHTPFAAARCASGEPFRCHHCAVKLQAELYPAILRHLREPGQIGALAADGEASCFYHQDKQAAKVCSSCGRFLCTLCEIDLAGHCLCPLCLEQGRQTEQIASLVNKRVLHDSIALSTALLPLLAWPLTVITAPVALFLSITAWNKPNSILRRSKVRLVAALVFSGLQLLGWGALGLFLLQKWFS